jgi:hypothetical protein
MTDDLPTPPTTCADFQAELPAYHFALLAPAIRPALEAHLLTCRTCLAGFLAIKRDLETSADLPRPSDTARARLRAAVATELAAPTRTWPWWQRPLALTLAAAAMHLAIATVSGLHTRPAHPPHSLTDPR